MFIAPNSESLYAGPQDSKMLWLIKWTLIFMLVGAAWFSYGFINNLSMDQKKALKQELISAIEGEKPRFEGPMVQKAKSDFFLALRANLKGLVEKFLD